MTKARRARSVDGPHAASAGTSMGPMLSRDRRVRAKLASRDGPTNAGYVPAMTCQRCGVKMQETRGTHHKQKKWRCPSCGRARMEKVTLKGRPKERAPRDD